MEAYHKVQENFCWVYIFLEVSYWSQKLKKRQKRSKWQFVTYKKILFSKKN